MATIDSLGTSISDMPRPELYALLTRIRTQRRLRPQAKKAAPAKVGRAPSRKNPKQQDLFALAKGMTPEAKAKLHAELLASMT